MQSTGDSRNHRGLRPLELAQWSKLQIEYIDICSYFKESNSAKGLSFFFLKVSQSQCHCPNKYFLMNPRLFKFFVYTHDLYLHKML